MLCFLSPCQFSQRGWRESSSSGRYGWEAPQRAQVRASFGASSELDLEELRSRAVPPPPRPRTTLQKPQHHLLAAIHACSPSLEPYKPTQTSPKKPLNPEKPAPLGPFEGSGCKSPSWTFAARTAATSSRRAAPLLFSAEHKESEIKEI